MGISAFVPITTHVVVVGTHVLRQMRSANLMYQIKCLPCLGTTSGYKVKCGEKNWIWFIAAAAALHCICTYNCCCAWGRSEAAACTLVQRANKLSSTNTEKVGKVLTHKRANTHKLHTHRHTQAHANIKYKHNYQCYCECECECENTKTSVNWQCSSALSAHLWRALCLLIIYKNNSRSNSSHNNTTVN